MRLCCQAQYKFSYGAMQGPKAEADEVTEMGNKACGPCAQTEADAQSL